MGATKISYYVMPGLKQKEVKFEQVIRKVCEIMKVDRYKVFTPDRSKELVFARNMCYYIFRRYFSMTLKEIGQVFERDHTTVIHGITTFENDLGFMKLYKAQYEQVKQELGLNMANKNLLTLSSN